MWNIQSSVEVHEQMKGKLPFFARKKGWRPHHRAGIHLDTLRIFAIVKGKSSPGTTVALGQRYARFLE